MRRMSSLTLAVTGVGSMILASAALAADHPKEDGVAHTAVTKSRAQKSGLRETTGQPADRVGATNDHETGMNNPNINHSAPNTDTTSPSIPDTSSNVNDPLSNSSSTMTSPGISPSR